METKKIFVLGNGFDLAHYLPTAYIHFMEAMQVVENSHTSSELGFDDLFKSRLDNEDWFLFRTKELYKTDELILPVEVVDDLREKLKNNGWFQHFKRHLSDVDTWIDFETEIERVLNSISIILQVQFQGNEINKEEHGSFRAILRQRIIQNPNLLDFNKDFFNQFGIHAKYYQQIFKNFKIFTTHYTIFDSTLKTENQCYVTSKNDYEKVEASVRNFYTTFGKPIGRSIEKQEFNEIIDKSFLKHFSYDYIGFNESNIFKVLSKELKEFSEIFSDYISKFINNFIPIKPFLPFGGISDKVEMVFTFNYSNSFQRFYASHQNKSDITRHLHGDAEKRNIVFGISDLDESLKKYKIFEFVKTYQKIINNTDFQFLDEKELEIKKLYDFATHNRLLTRGIKYVEPFKYEIIIWGHSLDVSDKEYIQEIFSLKDKGREHETFLKVYYHQTPHSSLANLMNIMGKDIIQKWVKNKWLKFEETPDIYQIYQVHYKDKDA